jgi:hypothetical protein
MELPKCTHRCTLQFSTVAKIEVPSTLNPLPTRAKPRRDAVEPICTKLSTLHAEPNLAALRTLHELPKKVLLITEVFSTLPHTPNPITDKVLPKRTLHLMLMEDPR